ncbi:unnamed protein product [Prorocentrum cordatum]|uniref:ribose-phosphate diphosphokinase n=1 Tax=Prorocentrum cordatum TaxID=2364126 RepID=A0ABN9V742_9DINO|nr:unnamed protein product [Polarella glacialis]
MMLDALKSEAPHRITVVLPCVEYARQDRKFEAGEAIAPKLFFHLMVTAGADRFVTMDLHNQAESGFSPAHAALDELSAEKYLASFIRENIPGFNTENLARYWFCKQCHGKRKEVEAAAPPPPSGAWADSWADWDKWAALGATSAVLPVGLQGGTSPPPVAGDEDKLSEEELQQLISLNKKMGNSSAAAALQNRLDKRRVGDAPVPLQAQANQVDRHIKQLGKKLQHDLDQYTKWHNWPHDKKESIGATRRELAAEVGKYQTLVEQLRIQVCPPPAAQPKARVSLQDLLAGESDFLDMSNVEEVFGIDSSVYEVQEADTQELEKRTTQLKEAIQASARQLFGEAKQKFDELKQAHAAHVGRLGKKRKDLFSYFVGGATFFVGLYLVIGGDFGVVG